MDNPVPWPTAAEAVLQQLTGDAAAFDNLPYGVIGFDAGNRITHYNATEARCTGLVQTRVLDRDVFSDVAQCMNNYLVAERFHQARQQGVPLDDTIRYVLTWRMAPTPVLLRLLWMPGADTAWLLLHRLS